MSNDELVSDTIESVLVGMADSLRQAQDSLSLAPPLDQFGRVVPQYEIPVSYTHLTLPTTPYV